MFGRGRIVHGALLTALLFAAGSAPSRCEELTIVAHVHTPVSGGEYTPDELAGMLADQGLDGAIVTDHDRLEIEWGLPLFRHFVRYRYRRTSIATEGPGAYAGAIRAAAERFPGLLLLPGIESNPYYRVRIDPWRLRVRVLGLHEHILAFGLPDSGLIDAPSVPNGFHPSFGRWVIAYTGAAVVFLAAAGVWLLRHRPVRLRALRLRRRRAWPLAAVTILVGLALVDQVALRASVFHPYADEDPGAAPFQSFIDWVAARGGLTFWAHPGVNETIRRGPVEVITRPYHRHLADTDQYDGLTGPHPAMIGPGGFWDGLLGEHCAGRRERAPWFLAQADFRSGSPRRLWSAVNHVSAAGRSERALLDALRSGRFYSTRSYLGRRWRLRAFRAETSAGEATAGERLEAPGPVTIVTALEPRDAAAPPLRIQIIGNGRTVFDRWIDRAETIRFDEPGAPSGCRWYRMLAGRSSKKVQLITNPIFVASRRATVP